MIVVDRAISAWVSDRIGGQPPEFRDLPALGIVLDGKLVGGASFHGWTGSNIFADVAIDEPRCTKRLFWAIMHYSFVQLSCTRLTFTTESSNLASIELQRRIGAEREAVLKGAGRNGNDILISVLWADGPFWRKIDGKVQHSRQPRLHFSASATDEGRSVFFPDSNIH